MQLTYRGRFAPSPTGPLHIGSLIAALASFLDARFHSGIWLVRVEDIDPPREQAGAADLILASLRAHGLHWDEQVCWQSERSTNYDEAIALLQRAELAFPCNCSRRAIKHLRAYPGTCRHRAVNRNEPHAIRVRVPIDTRVEFSDGIQGEQLWLIGEQPGDFIIKRKDALYAYQLAVAFDDAAQQITHVVRGADLLDSTPRQIYLMRCLGLTVPEYLHLPVITDREGHKFSKQTFAAPIVDTQATQNLRLALRFLKQAEPPPQAQDVEQILKWAANNWSREAIPRVAELPATVIGLN